MRRRHPLAIEISPWKASKSSLVNSQPTRTFSLFLQSGFSMVETGWPHCSPRYSRLPIPTVPRPLLQSEASTAASLLSAALAPDIHLTYKSPSQSLWPWRVHCISSIGSIESLTSLILQEYSVPLVFTRQFQ